MLCSNPVMRIALIGHGAMGKIAERLAVEKGHKVVATIHESEAALSAAELAERIRGADVAIDFTVATAKLGVQAILIRRVAHRGIVF